MVKMEENSTAFGNATIAWEIKEDSKKINVVYKKMRNFVRLLDQVQSYDDLYKVLRILRPSEDYKIVSVKLDSDGILLRLNFIEPDAFNNVAQ